MDLFDLAKTVVDESKVQRRNFDLSQFPPLLNADGVLLGLAGKMAYATVGFETSDGERYIRPALFLTTQSGELGLYVAFEEDHIEAAIKSLESIRDDAIQQNLELKKQKGVKPS